VVRYVVCNVSSCSADVVEQLYVPRRVELVTTFLYGRKLPYQSTLETYDGIWRSSTAFTNHSHCD
jgi:hypothetical protein